MAVEPRRRDPGSGTQWSRRVLGWDADPGDPPLTLPQERALGPASCPPTSLLNQTQGWPLPAGSRTRP